MKDTLAFCGKASPSSEAQCNLKLPLFSLITMT